MKNFKVFFLFALVAISFASCEDDATKAVLKSSVGANQLQAPSSNSFVLTSDEHDNVLETFQWTAPDFGYKASIAYTLQADIAGNNFANAVEVATSTTPEVAVNVGEFNDIMLGLGLTPETPGDVDLRVVSSIGAGVPLVYSNTQTIEVTSFATSFPPIWGMGAALKGWGPWPDNAVEWQSSEFKKYETIAYFTNGQAFRWFSTLSWDPPSYNYPFFTTVSPIFENANDGDSNLKVVGATGWYKVNVDLAAKTVAAVPVNEPIMYMTGPGVGAWDQPGTGASVKMTYVKPGVFTAETNFNNGGAFRFFPQADWSASYNFPFFTSVPDEFENAADGDSNFKFIGVTGSRKITVNINDKTVTVGEPPLPVLFITGDDFGWGWNAGQYEEMTYNVGTGTFTVTADLTNNALFRFFPQKDWSPSYTYEYFTTIDSDLGDQGPGDHNFRFLGTTGSKTITVNLTTKTIAID